MNGDTINIQELKELAGILNPDLLRFMELAQNMDTVLMPVKGDKLIFASQAAEVLHVGAGMIYRYVEEGLLRAVYTPHSGKRKFWLSEVKALAKEEPLDGKEGRCDEVGDI